MKIGGHQSLPRSLGRARRLQLNGTPEEYLAFTRGAVARFPTDPDVRLHHAIALAMLQPERARTEALRAVELDHEGNPFRLYRAGNLLLGAGDLAAARRCAERAVAAAPTNRVLVNLLTHLQGRIASVAGEDDIAEPLLRSAYEAEPRNGRNVLDLARFLLARERIDETLELLDCASTLEGPRKAREHYAQEFAGLRERIGRFQKLQLQISRVQARHSLGPARVSSSTPTRAARGANSPA